MSSQYQQMIEEYMKAQTKPLTSGHMIAPQNMGILGTANTMPEWGIDWSAVRNAHAEMATANNVETSEFFGQKMLAPNTQLTMARKVNLLWALGFRLQMAGIYRNLESRVYAAATIGEEVHVFMQTKQGKAVLVTDGKTNFPSDELITKLRMLEG